jgi:ketosteroid isomerase-like protein
MSDNKAIIQRLYEAFDRGDIAEVVSALAPDASWTEAEGFPYGGTYIGADDILTSVFMRLATEWDGWTAVANELIAEGDTVIAIGEYSGTYRATGKSFKAPLVHVWKMKDGLVQSFVQHTDTVVVRDAM